MEVEVVATVEEPTESHQQKPGADAVPMALLRAGSCLIGHMQVVTPVLCVCSILLRNISDRIR
jgi:hypothetical protein